MFISTDRKAYKGFQGGAQSKSLVQNLKYHGLRRRGAMRYYRLGVPVTLLQRRLGPSDIAVTMRYLGLVGMEQTPSLNRAWQEEQKTVSKRKFTKSAALG